MSTQQLEFETPFEIGETIYTATNPQRQREGIRRGKIEGWSYGFNTNGQGGGLRYAIKLEGDVTIHYSKPEYLFATSKQAFDSFELNHEGEQ